MNARLLALSLAGLLSMQSSAGATIIAITDPAIFDTTVASSNGVFIENFDGAGDLGTVIPSGSSFGNITFNYTWGSGESIVVSDQTVTNSGANYLGGTSGAGNPVDLINGLNTIDFTAAFSGNSASGIGMFVIVDQGSALSGDIRLTSGGVTASLPAAPLLTITDPSDSSVDDVFFLGLVEDTGASIGTVVLDTDPGVAANSFNYRVDGIRIAAVPEPGSFSLCMLVAAGALFRRRSRS